MPAAHRGRRRRTFTIGGNYRREARDLARVRLAVVRARECRAPRSGHPHDGAPRAATVGVAVKRAPGVPDLVRKAVVVGVERAQPVNHREGRLRSVGAVGDRAHLTALVVQAPRRVDQRHYVRAQALALGVDVVERPVRRVD